jgi:hypothetical protein
MDPNRLRSQRLALQQKQRPENRPRPLLAPLSLYVELFRVQSWIALYQHVLANQFFEVV